jgi:hypothetical protein
VVPTGKEVDRVDVRTLQRVGKDVGVKIATDALDRSAGVEVEVNLAKRQFDTHHHPPSLSCSRG